MDLSYASAVLGLQNSIILKVKWQVKIQGAFCIKVAQITANTCPCWYPIAGLDLLKLNNKATDLFSSLFQQPHKTSIQHSRIQMTVFS